MKKNTLILACIALSLVVGFGVNRVSAQILANDDAGVYTTWTNGQNAGFGFQPWVFYNTNGTTGFAGEFHGNGGQPIDSTNGNFWGTYANSSKTAASEEFRAFSNSLPVNATFKIRWNNNGIGDFAYDAGGFNLRNGDNTNLQTSGSFLSDGSLFSFYYIGGGGNNFVVYDGNGVNPVPITYQTANAGGLLVQVTLLPNSMYNLQIENSAGTSVLWSTNAQPLVGGGTIDSVALFDFDASGDQDFNDTEIYYAAPQIGNLTPANGTPYVPTDSALSFAVMSAASTISSNNIQLILNGVVQSGANYTVLNSDTSSNEVVLDGPFEANQVFNGTIIATDANGSSSTNNFSFNTWLTEPYNIYIEAGDYNYGGGQWVNNFTAPEPNQTYGEFDLLGTNDIDYYIYDFAYTNNPAPYRPGDFPYVEPATDIDHDSFAANGFTPYDLGFNETGQWEDYTRQLSNNVTYAVYARMAGFNASPVMQMERMATAEVDSSNQSGAVLGQFNVPQTGGTQNYTFVPLTDFFSNPVLVNFGGGTNTFRTTDIGGSGSYNVGYLLLVAVTNTATVRPYLTSGFPYPGAQGVNPLNQVQFTIANEQTSVNPASIQLFINSNNVTSSLTFSNNAAGTIVTYQPGNNSLFPAGPNYAQVIFSDGSVMLTNSWQFNVETIPVLPVSWALPLSGSFSRGFYEQIAKGDDSAPSGDFPPSVARAEAQLAGTLTNAEGVPYANEALNAGTNIENGMINYAIDSEFNGIFQPTSAFPDIPLGTTNNVAMAATMYVMLTPGVYNFDVYSDDGFQFTAMNAANTTNIVLGVANFGRAPSGTEFSFIVQTAGLYPMQLIYFKAQEGGGGVELYSIANGVNTPLNQPGNSSAVQVYYQLPAAAVPKLSIALSGHNVVLTWNGPSYSLESAPVLTGPYTIISGATSPWSVPISGAQQYFQLVPTP